MKVCRRLLMPGLATVFAGVLSCAAQARAQDNPVQWSITDVPTRAFVSGTTLTLKLTAQIRADWHLYALDQEEGGPIPTEISLSDASFLSVGTIRASKPIQLLDPNFNRRVRLYVDSAEFRVPLTIATDAPTGLHHTSLHMRYQTCTATMCLPPRTAVVDFSLSIKARR